MENPLRKRPASPKGAANGHRFAYKRRAQRSANNISIIILVRGVPDHGRPSISGSIRSIKMYSWAQCTMHERLVCSGDVPWVAQEEQRFGPFHPEHLPPPHLPGVVGTQFTSNLGPGGQDRITPKEGFQVSKGK
jgi:hypothetical protein